MDLQRAQAVVSQNQSVFEAWTSILKSNPGSDVYVLTLALDTAQDPTRPLSLNFPFCQVYVRSASDSNTQVNIRVDTMDNNQGSVPLTKRSSLASFPLPFVGCFLDWSAQTGKQIVLEFHKRSTFTPGNVDVTTFTYDGSGVTSDAALTVGVAAAVLLAANANRKVTTIQNQGATSIYVGDANVTLNSGANPGIEVPPGGTLAWRNTAALYAISSAAGVSVASLTET